jgi:hypothetical protein
MATNFGDFQNEVYAEAVKGKTSLDTPSISSPLSEKRLRPARLAIDNGANIIYCTNHGGRQANSGISTLQLLPAVVKAAGSTPVMFDSGVRDATDVIIALALGATAVGIGRPRLWVQGHRHPEGSGLRTGHALARVRAE